MLVACTSRSKIRNCNDEAKSCAWKSKILRESNLIKLIGANHQRRRPTSRSFAAPRARIHEIASESLSLSLSLSAFIINFPRDLTLPFQCTTMPLNYRRAVSPFQSDCPLDSLLFHNILLAALHYIPSCDSPLFSRALFLQLDLHSTKAAIHDNSFINQ